MRNWIIGILLIIATVLLLLNLDSCKKNRQTQSDYKAIKDYPDTIMYYKAKYGSQVEYNKSLEVSEKSLLLAVSGLQKEVDRLRIKNLRNVTNLSTEARIDTVTIGFRDSLPCDDFSAPFDTIARYYEVHGRVTNKGVTLNSIAIPDSQQIITATKKNGLFKRNELIVTITHTNPHVKTTGLQNYSIKKNQKRLSFGPSITYGLSLPMLKPELVVGVSMQYKLFGF